MSKKAKKIITVLVISVILIGTFIIWGGLPMSKDEAIDIADAFLAAVENGDYEAAALLYHPIKNMTAEKLKENSQRNPDLPINVPAHHIPFGSELTNIEHRGYYKIKKQFSYSLTTAFSCEGNTYVITFTIKRNILGHGITECSCLPID